MAHQLRNFLFTRNNWTDECRKKAENFWQEFNTQYIVFGEEIGEKENTPHLQGYIELKGRVVFDKITKYLPGYHIEHRFGSQSQAIAYCKKGSNIYEWGTPKAQGSRNDIRDIKDYLDADCSMARLLSDETITLNSQTLRTAERLVRYCDKPRKEKPFVIWIWGPPGVGKTKWAVENVPDAYFKTSATGKWWANYDGESRIIIDDIRQANYSFTYMLGLLDRYPFQVEDKGTIRQFRGRLIVITSPMRPEVAYANSEHGPQENIDQLLRRIDAVMTINHIMYRNTIQLEKGESKFEENFKKALIDTE